MNKSGIIAGLVVVFAALAAGLNLSDRIELLEARVARAETALGTLDPLRKVMAAAQAPVDSYQPVQATGAPNVGPEAKDSPLSWCPRVEDGGEEWLLLVYPRAIEAVAAEVHAGFNPGAVVRAAVVADDGKETEVWSGAAQPEGATLVTRLPFAGPVAVRRLKLILATGAVKGWNEIDAVALVGAAGELNWAAQATASSVWQAPPVAK